MKQMQMLYAVNWGSNVMVSTWSVHKLNLKQDFVFSMPNNHTLLVKESEWGKQPNDVFAIIFTSSKIMYSTILCSVKVRMA